jgi:hypothetical protein
VEFVNALPMLADGMKTTDKSVTPHVITAISNIPPAPTNSHPSADLRYHGGRRAASAAAPPFSRFNMGA